MIHDSLLSGACSIADSSCLVFELGTSLTCVGGSLIHGSQIKGSHITIDSFDCTIKPDVFVDDLLCFGTAAHKDSLLFTCDTYIRMYTCTMYRTHR